MAKKTTTPSADYEIGRGKPPKKSQFKPGQSGNPGGRKKGSHNVKTLTQMMLESPIVIRENGRERTVSMLEALMKRGLQEGLKGSLRAIEYWMDKYAQYQDESAAEVEEMPEEDQAILQRFASGSSPRSPHRDHDNEAQTTIGDADDQ